MVSKELLLKISAYFGGISSGLLIAMLNYDSVAPWRFWLSFGISTTIYLVYYKAYLSASKKEYENG